MKELKVIFTDAEFRKLKKAKKEHKYTNWHNFIIDKCSKGISVWKNLQGGKTDGKIKKRNGRQK